MRVLSTGAAITPEDPMARELRTSDDQRMVKDEDATASFDVIELLEQG